MSEVKKAEAMLIKFFKFDKLILENAEINTGEENEITISTDTNLEIVSKTGERLIIKVKGKANE
jgi:hypothetical protein